MNEKEYEKGIKLWRKNLHILERDTSFLRPEPEIDSSIPLRRRIPLIDARRARIKRNENYCDTMCWLRAFFFLYDNDDDWREYARNLSIDYVADPTAAP